MKDALPARDSRRALLARSALLGLALCWFFESWWGFRLVDLTAFDWWLRDVVTTTALRREVPRAGVAVAAIDEASLRALGRWPWDWKVHARIVEALDRLGARTIGFDLVLFGPAAGGLPAGAAELEAALRTSGKVVLGAGLETRGDGLTALPMLPPPRLQAAARSVAWVMLPIDRDGALRRFGAFPSSARGVVSNSGANAVACPGPDRVALPYLDVALAALHAQAPLPAVPGADNTVELAGSLLTTRIPLLEDRSTAYIRFSGGGPIPTFSCADLLEGRIREADVKFRTVLVGYTAELLQDRYRVPQSVLDPSRMPGVVVHAHAVQTLLAGRGLAEAPGAVQTALRYGLPLVAGLAVALLGPAAAASLLLALLGGLLGGAAAACQAGWALELARPMVLPILTQAACLAIAYARESARAKAIRHMFAHYVNDSIVEMLVREPERLQLGGEKKLLTVMFSDVRGFTTLSERLGPEALVQLLNDYLTRMTDLVLSRQGTLDKYIGDALMAVFGAPVPQADHAARACDVALEMLEALKAFNAGQEAAKHPVIAIGIGLNTGEMIVGNMGSRLRFDYTVMGDAVNLASRLEGQTKTYGVSIIVGDATRQEAGAAFVTRELDLIRVKGKLEPVRIHELAGRSERVPEEARRGLRLFEEGLASYRQQDWRAARSSLEAVLRLRPGDGPSTLFLQRVEAFEAAPPPAGWDGVFTATTK